MIARRRLGLAVAAAIGLVTWADFVVRILAPAWAQPHWPGYWVAARLVLVGRAADVYADPSVFAAEAVRLGSVPDIFLANAPAGVLPILPFGILPEQPAHQVWLIASLITFVGAWGLLLWALRLRADIALALTALLPVFHPFRDNAALGQVYGVAFAATAVAVVGVARSEGRRTSSVVAGIGLGALGVLKLYYGLVLGLVPIVERRWRLVSVAALIIGLAVVGTSIAWGPALWFEWLPGALTWRSRPETVITAYQTLNSLFGHLFRFDPLWNPRPVADVPVLADVLWLAATLLLVSITVLAIRFRSREAFGDETHIAGSPSNPTRAALPFAAAVPVAVLVSPVAEDDHYVLLLVPIVVTLAMLVATAERMDPAGRPDALARAVPWIVLAGALVLLGGAWLFNVPEIDGPAILLAYPRVYGALLLWGLDIALLRRWSIARSGSTR